MFVFIINWDYFLQYLHVFKIEFRNIQKHIKLHTLMFSYVFKANVPRQMGKPDVLASVLVLVVFFKFASHLVRFILCFNCVYIYVPRNLWTVLTITLHKLNKCSNLNIKIIKRWILSYWLLFFALLRGSGVSALSRSLQSLSLPIFSIRV